MAIGWARSQEGTQSCLTEGRRLGRAWDGCEGLGVGGNAWMDKGSMREAGPQELPPSFLYSWSPHWEGLIGVPISGSDWVGCTV